MPSPPSSPLVRSSPPESAAPANKRQRTGELPSASEGVNSENSTTRTAFQTAAKTLNRSLPCNLFGFFCKNPSIKDSIKEAVEYPSREFYKYIPNSYQKVLEKALSKEKKQQIPEGELGGELGGELTTLLATKNSAQKTDKISSAQQIIFLKYIPACLLGNLSLEKLDKLEKQNEDPDFLKFTDNINNLEIALEVLQKVLQETNPNQDHQEKNLSNAMEAITTFRKTIINADALDIHIPLLSDDDINNLAQTIKSDQELLAKVLASPDDDDETPTNPTQAATSPTSTSPQQSPPTRTPQL